MIFKREDSHSFWWPIYYLAMIALSSSIHGDESHGLDKTEDFVFRAEHDGSEQRYVVLTPAEFVPNQATSVLIALHGHGSDRWQFIRQQRGECKATRDVVKAHNMILISPDYRAPASWMGPAAEADLVQLIRIVKKRLQARNIFLCGGSMGGSGALTFTALHPELIDGVVALNGTANLVEYTRFQKAISASFGGSKQHVPEEYRQRSAEFYPSKFTMPFAATTGGKDNVVPPDSVLRLIDLIRKINPKVLSIHRPDGSHSTSYDDTKRALEFVIHASVVRSRSSAVFRQTRCQHQINSR